MQITGVIHINNMNRPDSMQFPPKRPLNIKPSPSGKNYQPSSYFGPPPTPLSFKQGPKSQRSLDASSVRSFNAVQGSSLRGSMASVNSAVSGFSRKSQKSVLSNYPQMVNKQTVKAPPPVAYDTESNIKEERKSVAPSKNLDEKKGKKLKIECYVDEDYFYSSQFKRNFVKGMLALAKNKNVQDLALLLKQVAPTIKVRSNQTSIWVQAFLIIFKIQHKLRRIKPSQQNVTQLIEDELIEFMHQNKKIKKARLMKIVVYLFRELPIHKIKVVQWFEDFVRKNRDRLVGIDLSRYVDIYTINPCPIDYDKLSVASKSSMIKAKQAQKQKQRQTQKKEVQREIQKKPEAKAIEKIEQAKQIRKQYQKESSVRQIPMKQVSVKESIVKQSTIKQPTKKEYPLQQKTQKMVSVQKAVSPIIPQAPQIVTQTLEITQVNNKIQAKATPSQLSSKIESKTVPPTPVSAPSITTPAKNTEKNVGEKKQTNVNPSEPQLSLQQLISKRMEQNAFSGVQKTKPKQAMKFNAIKQQPIIRQSVSLVQNIQEIPEKVQTKQKSTVEQRKEPIPPPATPKVEPQKVALTQKIKRLAQDRHEEIKSQAKATEQANQKPEIKYQAHNQQDNLSEQMEDVNSDQNLSEEDYDDDSFVDVSGQSQEQFSDQ